MSVLPHTACQSPFYGEDVLVSRPFTAPDPSRRVALAWRASFPRTKAIDVLIARGYQPYFLISVFEEAQLRRQFGFPEADDGPGSIVAVMSDPEQVRIYDPLRRSTGRPATIPTVVACPCGISP